MDDLVAWLRVQLDDDAGVAARLIGMGGIGPIDPLQQEGEHITRWNPGRALSEVDAKRQVLELYEIAGASREVHADAWQFMKRTVRMLALPYAARPGYRDEWKS